MSPEAKAAESKVEKKELLFIEPPPEFLVGNVEVNDSVAWKKFKQNPVAPLGILLTTFALVNGLRYMYQKNSVKQQKMMRLRVGAQFFSVLSILGGITYASYVGSK